MPREPTVYHRFCELRVKWAEESNILTAEPETREEIIQLIADMLKESVKDESVYLPQDMRWILANELEYFLSGYKQTLFYRSKPAPRQKNSHPILDEFRCEGVHWLKRKIFLGACKKAARDHFMKAFKVKSSAVSKWMKKFARQTDKPEIYYWHSWPESIKNPLTEADVRINRLGELYCQVRKEVSAK